MNEENGNNVLNKGVTIVRKRVYYFGTSPKDLWMLAILIV